MNLEAFAVTRCPRCREIYAVEPGRAEGWLCPCSMREDLTASLSRVLADVLATIDQLSPPTRCFVLGRVTPEVVDTEPPSLTFTVDTEVLITSVALFGAFDIREFIPAFEAWGRAAKPLAPANLAKRFRSKAALRALVEEPAYRGGIGMQAIQDAEDDRR